MASEETAKAQLDALERIASFLASSSEAQQQTLDLEQRRAANDDINSSGSGSSGGGGAGRGGGGAGGGLFTAKNIGRFSEFATDPFQSRASKSFATAKSFARSAATFVGADDSFGDAVYNASGLAMQQRIHQDAESATRALLKRHALNGGTVTDAMIDDTFARERAKAQRAGDVDEQINARLGFTDAIDGKAAGMALGKEVFSQFNMQQQMLDELKKQTEEMRKKGHK